MKTSKKDSLPIRIHGGHWWVQKHETGARLLTHGDASVFVPAGTPVEFAPGCAYIEHKVKA